MGFLSPISFKINVSSLPMAIESSKKSISKTRACLNCSIILKTETFKATGCPNCPFLWTKRDRSITATTSASHKGTIALIDPKTSWVGKWQRISNFKPGLYAMKVEGDLPDDYINLVEKDGRVYINRSNSFSLN